MHAYSSLIFPVNIFLATTWKCDKRLPMAWSRPVTDGLSSFAKMSLSLTNLRIAPAHFATCAETAERSVRGVGLESSWAPLLTVKYLWHAVYSVPPVDWLLHTHLLNFRTKSIKALFLLYLTMQKLRLAGNICDNDNDANRMPEPVL